MFGGTEGNWNILGLFIVIGIVATIAVIVYILASIVRWIL
jgi:hypothetical protein